MPWLAGMKEEKMGSGQVTEFSGDTLLLDGPEGRWGVMAGAPDADPRTAARELYTRLLHRMEGRRLYRVWNYVPRINEVREGVENYQAFNAGRHAAFREAYGEDFARLLPAASALGIGGSRLALCFLAGHEAPRHVENPEQVPAFRYPASYGPVPPSFARGTVVTHAGGATGWYLSGTASIKGHLTCGADFAGQASLTFDNVRLMFQRMELPGLLPGAWKIFLRHRRDLEAARAALESAFPGARDSAMFVEAEICRASLLLEVEATFHRPAHMAAPHTPQDSLGENAGNQGSATPPPSALQSTPFPLSA